MHSLQIPQSSPEYVYAPALFSLSVLIVHTQTAQRRCHGRLHRVETPRVRAHLQRTLRHTLQCTPFGAVRSSANRLHCRTQERAAAATACCCRPNIVYRVVDRVHHQHHVDWGSGRYVVCVFLLLHVRVASRGTDGPRIVGGPDRPIPQPKPQRPKPSVTGNGSGASGSRQDPQRANSVSEMANSASRGVNDLYSRLNNALAERG